MPALWFRSCSSIDLFMSYFAKFSQIFSRDHMTKSKFKNTRLILLFPAASLHLLCYQGTLQQPCPWQAEG